MQQEKIYELFLLLLDPNLITSDSRLNLETCAENTVIQNHKEVFFVAFSENLNFI